MIKNHNKDSRNNKKIGQQRGFTLIEIIVSLAIFTIVAVVAVGAFIKILDANKKAQSLQTATNNLNFALESLTREMRVGNLYSLKNNNGTISNITKGSDIDNSRMILTSGSSVGSSFYLAFRSSAVSNQGNPAPCNLINVYKFTKISDNIKILKREQKTCGESINTGSDNGFTEVLSPNLKLDKVDILVNGRPNGSTYNQPYARFIMSGFAGPSEETRSYFLLQTSVTQRESINNF